MERADGAVGCTYRVYRLSQRPKGRRKGIDFRLMFAYDFSMTSLESVTTTVRRRSESAGAAESRHSDESATFKRVSTMSAAALEDFLGLPDGAWKKRRLFALRTMTDAHAEAGIPKGAQIVVEPGARTAPGRLVLVKDGTAGLTIRRVEYDDKGRTVMRPAAPGMLPFPSDGSRKQVMGTIIGVLPRARVAGRSVSSGRRPPTDCATQPRHQEKTVAQAEHERAAAILNRDMEIWSSNSSTLFGRASRGAQARWRALAGRLRVIASCLEVAHQKSLYGALVEEANRIIAAMRRELCRHDTPEWEELELLPQPSTALADRATGLAPKQVATSANAAKRHCTDPLSAGLDTGLTAMV